MNSITASEARKMTKGTKREAVYDQIRKAAKAGETAVVVLTGLDADFRADLESAGYNLCERFGYRFGSNSVWVVSWDKQSWDKQ